MRLLLALLLAIASSSAIGAQAYQGVTGSTVTATSQFVAPAGSATTPGYSFSGASNYGLFMPTGGIGFAVGGGEYARITASAGLALNQAGGGGCFAVGNPVSTPDSWICRSSTSGVFTVGTTQGGNNGTVRAGNIGIGSSGAGNWSATLLALPNDSRLGWSSTTNATAAMDTSVSRFGPGIVAAGQGPAGDSSGILQAATFRAYNLYTDASNWERGYIGWSGSAFTMATENLGTGASRSMQFVRNGVQIMLVGPSNSLQVTGPGGLSFNADNALDIGLGGAGRPRTIYVGTSIINAGILTNTGRATIGAANSNGPGLHVQNANSGGFATIPLVLGNTDYVPNTGMSWRFGFGAATGTTSGTIGLWRNDSLIDQPILIQSSKVELTGQLQLDSAAEPTCNAANRGTIAYVAGGAGVKDTMRLCAKDATDVYAYRTIY